MTRTEQLSFLIHLLSPKAEVPSSEQDKWQAFRSLINARNPGSISDKFVAVQDEMLKGILKEKGITRIENLHPTKESIYIWQGDITTLKVDAIVNAANSGMLGCFVPCHGCIDNAIHTYAGVQLRLECAKIMRQQGYPEPTGKAKMTAAYNLPCNYILHTVGPIINGKLTDRNRDMLAECYRSCLLLAAEHNLQSLAFCCISTGEFCFPNREAAEIAVTVVTDFLKKHSMKIVFNVFKDTDRSIYHELLK